MNRRMTVLAAGLLLAGILALSLWLIAPHSMDGPEIAMDRDQAQVD